MKDKNIKSKHLKIVFPEWVPLLYGIACIVLIPWTLLLAYLLPRHYISHNWDIAWVGFDILEILLFGLTAILVVRKSFWTSLTSGMLSIVLIVDAWFDVLTTKPGPSRGRSILDALIIELPLALISLYIAIKIFKKINNY